MLHHCDLLHQAAASYLFASAANGCERLWHDVGSPTGLMSLDQIGIALSEVIAVWLTQNRRESWRRWACIFATLGQPFWSYAAWSAERGAARRPCMNASQSGILISHLISATSATWRRRAPGP